eukprot:13277356-Ditylum_brightwellii.AAC.1
MDGTKTWKGQYCYGVQKPIPYPLDGTFQNFVMALDTWEMSLLDNVKCHMDIFTVIKIMEKNECFVVTDGLVGEFDMSFG